MPGFATISKNAKIGASPCFPTSSRMHTPNTAIGTFFVATTPFGTPSIVPRFLTAIPVLPASMVRPAADPPQPRAGAVLTGLDALVRQNFALLAGRTIGLITNQTGLDATGRRTIDLLAAAPNLRL